MPLNSVENNDCWSQGCTGNDVSASKGRGKRRVEEGYHAPYIKVKPWKRFGSKSC